MVVATLAMAGVVPSVSARQLRPAAAPDARSVVLGEGLDAVRLDVLGERLFRARVAWTNEWTESPWDRYDIYHPEAFTNEAFEAAGDAVRSAGGELTGTADGALHFHSKVSPADVQLKLARVGKGFRIEVDLADGERLFGLGDCGRETLNRRGGKHRSTIEVYKQPREKGHRYWCAAPVPMLTSSRGWGLLVNSSFLLNWDIGATDKDKLVVTAEEGDADVYLFCGNGPRELLDVYTRFTGRPALLPCFALGLTFICNEHTGMHELLDYARLFREQGIPCDTMSLEPNWMSTWYDATTGKDWDRNVFKFRRPWEKSDGTWIDAHQRMGFKLGLWMCCNYDLTRYEEEQQVGRNIGTVRREDETFGFSEEIDTGLFGVNKSVSKSASKTAATAGDGSEPWFEHWKKFIDQGVRVFKLDGSQQMNPDPKTIANGMSKSELLNCYNALYQKQMTQGFSRHTGKRPFVISAAGSPGTQQYGTTWAGDTYGSEFSVVSILNMGLSGHPNHSMDMCVWGANSFHAGFLTTWPMLCDFAMWKAPWQMAEPDRDAFIAYAKLRYRLIPYVYSFAAEAHRTGFPYVRAMPLAYPDDPQWDDKRRQWMLGDSLLVSAYDDRVTLPPGTWYDWRSDHRLEGGQTVPVVRDAEWGGSLHVKAGAIVPTWENVSHIEKGWNERLSLHVWPQADGAFTLYEDDGDSLGCHKGEFAETPITVKTNEGVTHLTIGKRKGTFAGMPGSRAVTAVFHLGEGETKTCAVGAVGTEGAVVILDKQGARVDRTDVFIGTAGLGHVTPAASYPFGAVQAGPDTSERPEAFRASWSRTCGYQHGDGWLWRFSQTHISGTGCSSLGDFGLLPYPDGFDGTISPARLHKETERAAPGFYGVTLGEPLRLDVLNSEQRVDCEMTATARTAAYRFRYPRGFKAKLLLDLDWGIGPIWREGCRGKRVYSSACTFTSDRTAEGGRKVMNWNDYEVFFAASFSRPIVARRLVRKADGVRGDVYELEFGRLPDDTLEVRFALSGTSSAAAARNLAAESTGRTFDALREQAAAAWQAAAGRLTLDPATPADTAANFNSALYRLMLQPNDRSDVGDRPAYSTLSLWDTFRAAHPLYTIIAPERVAGFVNSMLDQYDRQGYLPIWSLGGGENHCMIGHHAVPVIVDACLKGVKGVDWERAFAAVKDSLTRSHKAAGEGTWGLLKEDWDLLDKYGYYPFDKLTGSYPGRGKVKGESVARLLECAYDDACAARLAEKLGKTEDAAFFCKRAGSWKNVFDPSVGFMRGKDSQGRWRTPFDPWALGGGPWTDNDFCEGNAWQYTWHVLHDPQGLIDAFGGTEPFVEKLTELFEQDPRDYAERPTSDVTGLIGQYAHGNEPSHHVIYFFSLAGHPDRTAKYVHTVFETQYQARPDGLCGNDDCGQMAAWYVFSALGFYPFDPCGGEYVLGAPQVPGATLSLPGGKTLRIRAECFSAGGYLPSSVTLNGRELKNWKVSHADLMAGGELVFRKEIRTLFSKP